MSASSLASPPSLCFGSSPAIAKLLRAAGRFAAAPWPILILGERGVGKTAFARWIHDQSRPREPFIKLSVPAIPPQMEHTYLAGHVRGSFTGAVTDQPGLFERANRGTFFVDEIGLATPSVQAVLLELLSDGRLTRLGESHPRKVDVRVIAATNADLEQMVAQGSFRADLRDRLGSLILKLPSLAARRDEILPLADQFLVRAAEELQLAQVPTLSQSVRGCLEAAAWPGNIRELESVCRYIALFAEPGRPVSLNQLPPDFLGTVGQTPKRRVSDGQIVTALHEHNGNRTRAARAIGISREHLQRRIRRA